MSLITRIQDLATRISTECKALRTLINGNAADLSTLTTSAKGNLVAAINELNSAIGQAGQVVDGEPSPDSAWSSSKTKQELEDLKDALTDGAGSALDTLKELADAIGSDPNFANTVTTALGNRVRFDAAQSLTAPQKLQACQNIGIGDPETNFVTAFNDGLA